MAAVEENGQRVQVSRLPSAFNPGGGDLAGGAGGAWAVQVDVPAQVEGGGEHHHARVVHPLPLLPLPAGQVGQPPALALEDDLDGGLLDVIREVAEKITNLQSDSPEVPHLPWDVEELHLVSDGPEPAVPVTLGGLRASSLACRTSATKERNSSSSELRTSSTFPSTSWFVRDRSVSTVLSFPFLFDFPSAVGTAGAGSLFLLHRESVYWSVFTYNLLLF